MKKLSLYIFLVLMIFSVNVAAVEEIELLCETFPGNGNEKSFKKFVKSQKYWLNLLEEKIPSEKEFRKKFENEHYYKFKIIGKNLIWDKYNITSVLLHENDKYKFYVRYIKSSDSINITQLRAIDRFDLKSAFKNYESETKDGFITAWTIDALEVIAREILAKEGCQCKITDVKKQKL